MQQKCPNCGSDKNRPDAMFCLVCGHTLSALVPAPGLAPSVMPAVAQLLLPSGMIFQLVGLVTTIGRDPDNDVVLQDNQVSRRHAEIREQGGGYVLEDLGSSNGTTVNGQRIAAPWPLQPGDQIGIGSTTLVFQGPATGLGPPGGRQPTKVVSGAAAGIPPFRTWPSPPQVEGEVRHVDGPHQEKKGGLAGKACLAVLLAWVYPVLAFLPFLKGSEITVRYLRVEDVGSGEQWGVTMRGDPSSNVAIGDLIAVWGKRQGRNVIMQASYNYTTDSEIRLKT